MELLLLLLLSPAIFAHGYRKRSNDPNEEPFLPIYPVYPYSPKLIKRGTERDLTTQLTPELYAPKVDARDSYTASYTSNYQRDPYYPTYNPYPKTTSPSTASSYGTSYYTPNPLSYSSSPYSAYNSYTPSYTPASPYTSASPYATSTPYAAATAAAAAPYPSYYYQPPYYYPNFYSQPYLAPPPPPPGYADTTKDSEPETKEKDKKSSKNQKAKDDDDNGGQFVDGANYISTSSKDLDGQSSTYKSSPYNQLEQLADQLKQLTLPLPKTTYRVVSVAGQPVGPDYPLPPAYVKAQQLEQLMSQALAKLLAQSNIQQQQVAQYQNYDNTQNVMTRNADGTYTPQNNYNKNSPPYVALPAVISKTGLAYVINPSTVGKLNVGQLNAGQATTTLTKNQKYTESAYSPKPVTRVTLQESQGIYIPAGKPGKTQTLQNPSVEYENYESTPNESDQNYNSSSDQQEQNQGANYVTAQTPQAYSYQYTGYRPQQTTTQQQQQQYKTNLEDVNFGTKNNSKG